MQSNRIVVPGLIFGSGFASLVYQVLWMRELGLLFGSTAYAAAGTLAVFFAGLAIGGVIWSRRAPRASEPLAEFGLLELGIGVSGAFYFGLMSLYATLYTPLHEAIGDVPSLLLIAKLALAAIVLLPPAILMGGTLPLMSQYVVTGARTLGRVGTFLYGTNTFGAAVGALAAGFWLPAWLGFRGAYLVAVSVSLVIGAIAWIVGRRQPKEIQAKKSAIDTAQVKATAPGHDSLVSLSSPKLVAIALGSGALALALEVLWTRMFQQVLQNSVYTFSIILVVFLVALSTGAFVARRIARTQVNPWAALAILLTVAGLASLASPFIFFETTDGMRYLAAGEAWSEYFVAVFGNAALVIFVPGVAIGSVFPYLLRIAERSGEAGQVVGRLAAINTTGAIIGSLVAGFVMLSSIGLWSSLLCVAVAYLVLGAWIVFGRSWKLTVVPVFGVLLALTFANPSHLPGVRINTGSEQLLASWEGPDGYVAVVERDGSRRIKINNFYALGSSAAIEHEQNQTLIPLMAHPTPEQLFYLGMGTGITAGASLRLPSNQVTVTELVPEVVTAAATYFDTQASGLFTDQRATVLARDGRNELRGRASKYDAIIADLFIPWRAGVGNLYSRDHYEIARTRLNPGGVYVQWIPLYQVTDIEFWTIVRTFLDVFPQVRVWRGDFYTGQPILALVGSVDAAPLDPTVVVRNGLYLSGGANLDPVAFLAVTLPFYAGNLGESRDIVPDGPIHTDDKPIIEYQAPISHRNARAGRTNWFVGDPLIGFFNELHEETPPNVDPYLSRLDPAAHGFVAAGLTYHTGAVLNAQGRRDEADRLLEEFVALLPISVQFDTVGLGSSVEEESQ